MKQENSPAFIQREFNKEYSLRYLGDFTYTIQLFEEVIFIIQNFIYTHHYKEVMPTRPKIGNHMVLS